jgi:hypothetical protein
MLSLWVAAMLAGSLVYFQTPRIKDSRSHACSSPATRRIQCDGMMVGRDVDVVVGAGMP